MDPRNSHAHLNLARALAAADELREALVEAHAAETLAPTDEAAHALVAALERAAIGRSRRLPS
jgi:hypothetical protein